MADRLQEVVEEALDVRLQWAEMEHRHRIDSLAAKCESPIEKLMAAALVTTDMPQRSDDCDLRARPVTLWEYSEWGAGPPLGVYVFAQQSILGYRVDFLVVARFSESRLAKVVVECDGHAFHEKTKAQASRDKQRDREMVGDGYHVMRFTGSEIYRDPLKCAAEVAALLDRLERQEI